MNLQGDWSELSQFVPWVESTEFETILGLKNLSVQDQRIARDLHQQGFAIIDGILDSQLVERVIRDTDLLFQPDIQEGPRSRYRVMDAWKESAAVRSLATHPEILRVLKMLYDREPVPFQTLNFLYGSQQRTHSDTIHFNSLPVRYMCGVWVALEDITEQNGPLHYYKGSHRLPDYDLFDFGLVEKGLGYGGYEDAVEKLMKEKNLERKTFTIPRGTLGIWAANLFHGGTPILSLGATRRSQVIHYFFEDCIYYSPVFSNRRAGELFLNDFDIKLNIQTLKPIQPNLNGQPVQFNPVGRGKFQVVQKNEPPKTQWRRRAYQLKSQLSVPWHRIKMQWYHFQAKN